MGGAVAVGLPGERNTPGQNEDLNSDRLFSGVLPAHFNQLTLALCCGRLTSSQHFIAEPQPDV